MPAVISTWEQVPLFDPSNPNQRVHVQYTGIPGGYGTFYYNKVPNTAKLQGLGAFALPAWAQAALVAVVGLGLGFFGFKYVPVKVRSKIPGLHGRRRK